MPNKRYDIYDRIFKLVVRVIRLTKLIPKTEENKVIISQLLRSATSMGANAQEADGVSTKKDFLHCFTTVRKEAKETSFWLKLIFELNSQARQETQNLISESEEIVAIVSKIITQSRK
jgi:four helix bundle protein